MDDLREKVISELQAEIDSAVYMGHSYKDCIPVSLLHNALSLLKAQEPKQMEICNGELYCTSCGNKLKSYYHYCEECGQAVKWE